MEQLTPLEMTTATFVGHIDVLEVEAHHLVSPGGGLVDQPPEAALGRPDALSVPEPLQLNAGEDTG